MNRRVFRNLALTCMISAGALFLGTNRSLAQPSPSQCNSECEPQEAACFNAACETHMGDCPPQPQCLALYQTCYDQCME